MKTFVIGRDTSSQIVLNDKLVSRRHAELTFLDNGQVIIKDLGSVNGTFVNGKRITECYLNAGDIVKCGSLFLNWAQYINSGQTSAQPTNYQQPDSTTVIFQEPDPVASMNEYNFSDVFRFLTTGIFEIGDLFKTSWNRTFSILFLKGVPVILTFIISIIAYSKYRNAEFYLSPTIFAVFIFAVCPFITMGLLSLNKKVKIDKVALASGIMGFIQFCIVLCFLLYALISNQHLNPGYGNIFTNSFQTHKGFDFFILVTTLLFVILLVNLVIALYVLIYKYFISIGVSRSKSIYLLIITVSINIFFNILSAYMIYLIGIS